MNWIKKLIIALTMTTMTQAEEQKLETVTLGAGCFWCVEAVYEQLDGVKSVVSGYMGGSVENPTYEQVNTKTTGHIEVVEVKYDPTVIKFETILEWFWKLHNPTTKDRQGADRGPQYASAIFYYDEAQQTVAEASMKAAQKDFDDPIVTYVRKAESFYTAEGYHQDYYSLNKNKNPYCRSVIRPKLKKLKLEY